MDGTEANCLRLAPGRGTYYYY